MIAALALRQVVRHWRTSLGALVGAAAGVAAIVFMAAVMRGLTGAVIANVVDMHTGAIVIERQGFMRDGVEDWRRDLDASVLLPRIAAVAGVKAATPRLVFDGVLSDGRASAAVRVTAIVPASEARVCPKRSEMELDEAIAHEREALLGRDLAARMGLARGDGAVLSAITPGGRQNALDLTVAGRSDSPVPFANKRAVTVHASLAQALLGVPGRASEIAVATDEEPEIVAARLRTQLGGDFRIETWREREPRADRFVATTELLARALSLALCVLVLGFVMNATRASVDERRREIGTMLALGARRKQILRLFVCEAGVIAVAAALTGGAAGWLACALAAREGLLLRAPGAKPFPVYPIAEPRDFAFAAGMIVLGALLAAAWPASMASRLSPRDALRED